MHSWRTAKRETDGQRCFNVFEANSEAVTGQQWTHPTRLLWTLQREAGCWRHHSFILNFVLCPRHHHSNYTTPFQTSVDRLGRAGKRNLPLSRSWIRNFSVILWRRCRRSPHSTQCQIMQSFSMIHFLRQRNIHDSSLFFVCTCLQVKWGVYLSQSTECLAESCTSSSATATHTLQRHWQHWSNSKAKLVFFIHSSQNKLNSKLTADYSSMASHSQ